VHLFLSIGQGLVFHEPFGNGEQGVISSHFDIHPGFDFCSALADQDIARKNGFTGEFLYSQPLGVTVATVSTGTTTFYVPLPLLHFD